jgi:hypothetical protein
MEESAHQLPVNEDQGYACTDVASIYRTVRQEQAVVSRIRRVNCSLSAPNTS